MMIALAGCWPLGKPPADGNAPEKADVLIMGVTNSGTGADSAGGGDVEVRKPADPVKTTQQLFVLEMYELAVPVGEISTNAEFWKPFDETFLGIWKHDVLYKNGLRVGKAPLTELPFLVPQLQDAEITEGVVVGVRGRDFSMPMKKGVEKQTIFSFDAEGRMTGRDYDLADNIFALTFRQTPRTSDHVRIAIAPAVREVQERLVRGSASEGPKFQRPQTFFELGIDMDLGADECLIISSADLAKQVAVSVGRAFMTEERPAMLMEKALVIIPRMRGNLTEVTPTVNPDGSKR